MSGAAAGAARRPLLDMAPAVAYVTSPRLRNMEECGVPVTEAKGGDVKQLALRVTDHDSWLGTVHICTDADDPAHDTPTCRDIRASQGFWSVRRDTVRGVAPPEICGESGAGPRNRCYERARHLWREVQKNADAFYEPGRFTTFPGYEWSANPNGRGHLHRNVIFRGDAVPEWGGSAVEMQHRPERLWEWLERPTRSAASRTTCPSASRASGRGAPTPPTTSATPCGPACGWRRNTA